MFGSPHEAPTGSPATVPAARQRSIFGRVAAAGRTIFDAVGLAFMLRPMARALAARVVALASARDSGRVLLVPVLLVGIGIAVSAGLLVLHLRERVLASAGRELERNALVLANQAERSLQAVDLVQAGLIEQLKGIETGEAYRQAMAGFEVHQDLRNRIRGLPQVDALAAFDAEGRLLNTSRLWPTPDLNVAERDYFKALKADPRRMTYLSTPASNTATGTWTVFVAHKVLAPDGAFLGVTIGALNLDYFERLYARTAFGSESAITLYRQDGVMLARHPHAEPNIGHTFDLGPYFQTIIATGARDHLGQRISVVDGRAKLAATQILDSYPLAILVADTMNEILADWRKQATWLLAAALLLDVVLAAAAMLVMRQMRSQRLLGAVQAELALARERERAQDQMRVQDARFGAALDNMTQALAMFDAEHRLIVANPKFLAMFNLASPQVALGLHFAELVDHALGMGLLDAAEAAATKTGVMAHIDGGKPVSYVREVSDGRGLAVSLSPTVEGGWLVTYDDITERRQAEARIVHMAQHDALTGLPNRVLFHDRLQEALARSRRGAGFAVLCLDLDHFKLVNDSLGHPIGDALLRAVTDRLRLNMRETDTVARLGGDEFAIIQTSLDHPTAVTDLAGRLIEVLSAPYLIEGHSITIGVTIGIAMILGDGDSADADTLLKHADLALYRAKADGRGTFRFFEPEMDARMQARRALEVDLRQALAVGQFELFYQPVMDLASRTVSGFEALIRWRHPERGLVPPDAFIPLAEEIGLIVPIGEWVLRQACADAVDWPGEQKVAVNLSSIQFAGRGPVPAVAAALVASGLPPARLELEITETVMLDDTAATLETLRALKALGVSIAMDDFGTGYSSLSYLRKFPFDRVKIDKSFIADLGACTGSVAIVEAVTALCQTLGMATTAEGVETEVQFEGLQNGSCTNVQGYLFSKPRPASEVAELCRTLGPMSVSGAC